MLLQTGSAYQFMKSVLVINNKIKKVGELTQIFYSQGTQVIFTNTIEKALSCFASHKIFMVILDCSFSYEDDYQLINAIKQAKTTPVLVFSSEKDCDEATKRDALFNHGEGPYTLEECLAHAQYLLQLYTNENTRQKGANVLACSKDLVIDPAGRKVFLKGKKVHFTKKEFDLLFFLASNPDRVFSREQLYDKVWDEYAAYNIDDVVKAHIKSLRQKLSECDLKYIKNVWGVGYCFHND